jgi:hypothetical protein
LEPFTPKEEREQSPCRSRAIGQIEYDSAWAGGGFFAMAHWAQRGWLPPRS